MSPGPVPVPPVVMIRSARRLVLQQPPQRLRVVVADADPVRERAGLGGRGRQRVRVGVDHLAGWLARPTSTSSSPVAITDDPRAGPDHHVPDAGRGEHRHQRRGDVRPGRARGPCRPRSRRRRAARRDRAWAAPGPRPRPCPGRSRTGGTTTSAAAGSGAPAATEKQVPGVSRTGRQLDAPRSPTTLSRTGRWGAAPMTSSQRAAYPSIGGLVERGQRVRREHVLGEHVAVRLGEVQVERRQRPQPLRHLPGNRRAVSARGGGQCGLSGHFSAAREL